MRVIASFDSYIVSFSNSYVQQHAGSLTILVIMPRWAEPREAYSSSFVCVSFRLLVQFSDAR